MLIYYGPIIIIVKSEADISNVLDIPNLISIHVEKKLNEFLDWEIRLIFSQSHKGKDQWMLLPDLIDQNYLTSCISKL